MMPARACGTIRSVRPAMKMTTTAMTIRTIAIGSINLLRSVDKGSSTLDLHDVDRRPRFEHLVFDIGASSPDLAANLDLAVVRVDLLEHDCLATDQCRDPGLQLRRRPQMCFCDRASHTDQAYRPGDKRDQLYGDRAAEDSDDKRGDGGDRNESEDERQSECLSACTGRRDDGPDEPGGHIA